MVNPYTPKYLKPEPISAQAAADAEVIGLIRYNRSRIVDAELEAMVRRNPNRRVAEDAGKPALVEKNITDSGGFAKGLLLTAVMILLILATTVAAFL